MSLEKEWKRFIRPPRFSYSYFDLGPECVNLPNGQLFRHEITVMNRQNHQLRVSFFQLSHRSQNCILYCHGFNGCRIEGVKYAHVAAQYGLNFCAFDFQGCGQSEGEYITFGHLEKEDITCVIEQMSNMFQIKSFVLWGRSLGATTIQLKKQSLVAGYVLDSCFTDLNKLAVTMVQKQTSLPKFVIKSLMYFVKGTFKYKLDQIENKAQFRFNDIKIKVDSSVPTLYICSDQDSLIKSKNTIRLYQSHTGQRRIIKVEGEHNDCRAQELIQDICKWSWQQFMQPRSISEHSKPDLYQKYQHLVGRNSICRTPVDMIQKKYESNHLRERQNMSNRYDNPRISQVLTEFPRNVSHNPAKQLKNQIQNQLRTSSRSIRKPIFY